MTLQDARLSQRAERSLDEHATDPLSPVRRGHDEMLEVTSAAVVTTEHRANEASAVDGHEARARIPLEVARDGLWPIDVAEDDALGGSPERCRGFVVGRGQLVELNGRGVLLAFGIGIRQRR